MKNKGHLHITGTGNTVVFIKDGKRYPAPVSGVAVSVTGNNNYVELPVSNTIKKLDVVVVGNSNMIRMKQTKRIIDRLTLFVENGGIIEIGEDLSAEFDTVFVANGGKGRKISVGNDCMFSHGILVRTSDGHKILDAQTKAPLNLPKDISVGSHVWVGARSVLLKGTVIPDNCIVGACSVVTKAFCETNRTIAGNPAKVVSDKKITWNRDNYGQEEETMESDKVKLTVLCPTYNHEKFIARALNGFIMQKTNFKFEVIVADDASTDKTPEIVREYAEKHPDLIKPLLREKNMGAVLNFQDMIKNIPTEYVAICEGDDYWTDENKLQIQVDWLDAHPESSGCCHPVKVLFEDPAQKAELNPSPIPSKNGYYNRKVNPFKKADLTLEDIIKGVSIAPCSFVYRWRFKNGKDLDLFRTDVDPRDVLNQILHAETGTLHFINKVMGVYYRPKDSYWSKSNRIHKCFEPMMKFFDYLEERYGGMYYSLLEKQRKEILNDTIFTFYKQKDTEFLCTILKHDMTGFFLAIEDKLLKGIKQLKLKTKLYRISCLLCLLVISFLIGYIKRGG
ncbi:MAG: glycosyltransferase [Alphaproteobacteria bacterium]|nr:glycosyltransferase [Alphaproteobacteria bacterium]